jgi:hypothetical protein
MAHISKETLDTLYRADPTLVVCLHAISTAPLDPAAGDLTAVTRMVGHVHAEGLEHGAEVPADQCVVVDLPLTDGHLSLLNAHFGDTMDTMVENALDALTQEDNS